jgi:hypothetical protein
MRTSCLLAVAAFSCVSCTKITTVPPSSYSDPGAALSYRVHAADGSTYFVSDFTITDSTLVILSFRRLSYEETSTPPTPFDIALKEVQSVERVTSTKGLPIVLIALGVLVVGLNVLAVASAGN